MASVVVIYSVSVVVVVVVEVEVIRLGGVIDLTSLAMRLPFFAALRGTGRRAPRPRAAMHTTGALGASWGQRGASWSVASLVGGTLGDLFGAQEPGIATRSKNATRA